MRARRDNVYEVLKKYCDKPQKVKLLDFGCASGYFVGQLTERGYNAVGLDSSPEAIEIGHKEGIKNISVIRDKHIDFPDNYFDIALLLDVIEHLEDESWALKEVERVVKPGGIVVITVPAFMFLWGVMDEVAHHFRRYTIPRLLNVVAQFTNLQVIRKTYYNFSLFSPIALVRLFSRWFGIKGRESDFDLSNPLLDKIFFEIMRFERMIMRYTDFPFGVAILTVFKKPPHS